MLKWRVITALVLVPSLLALIWWLPTGGVAILFGLMCVLGGLEWARLVGCRSARAQIVYTLGLVVLLGAAWGFYQLRLSPMPVFILASLWWLVALRRLLKYNRDPQTLPVQGAVSGCLLSYVVLLFAWFALVYLHGFGGPALLTLLLFTVWGADTGAYFAGRAFGRRKLAVNVSPGKTWEGVFGGVALALVVSAGLQLWLAPAGVPLHVMLPLVVLTVLFSVAGDLFESMIKRQHGAKDSGNLLPGHGGVLDRVDALLAAAPIFAMGFIWWRLTL